ncbi:hypothetical protein WDV93_05020 [Pantoea ananatis]
MIELWVPVIAAILPYVIHHSGQDLTSFLSRTENPLQLVSEEVKNIINSLKAFQPIPALLVLSQHVE